jgi:hypothetical protein
MVRFNAGIARRESDCPWQSGGDENGHAPTGLLLEVRGSARMTVKRGEEAHLVETRCPSARLESRGASLCEQPARLRRVYRLCRKATAAPRL